MDTAGNAILVVGGVEECISSDLSHCDVRDYLLLRGQGPGDLWYLGRRVPFESSQKISPNGRYVFGPTSKTIPNTSILIVNGNNEEICSDIKIKGIIKYVNAMGYTCGKIWLLGRRVDEDVEQELEVGGKYIVCGSKTTGKGLY